MIKDISTWASENKEKEGVPDVDLIAEQHRVFRKQIAILDNKANICLIELKVIRQIRDVKEVVNKVKNLVECRERQSIRSKRAQNNHNLSSTEPRLPANENSVDDSLGPGPELEKGNAQTVQPVSLSVSNDSDPSYNPLEDSMFTKAGGNIGFELILEKLKVWRSSIEQVVTQGQDRVLAIEHATSSLQEVVTNISS